MPAVSGGALSGNPLTVNVSCVPNFAPGTDSNGTWAYQPNTNASLVVVFGRIKKATGNAAQSNASPFNVNQKCTAVFYPTQLGQPQDPTTGLEIALGTFSSACDLNIGKYAFRVNLIVYLTFTPSANAPSGTPAAGNYVNSYGHDPDMQVET